ncbi:hypothetical protein T11_9804 [Trichinella zimbabwensis]|uniref:Uncharacterized protein n=1 Tax=Trichinella zimbabwensis TaxID=268475 RepID=A0A0V1HSF0_9BILA|nr:hypothetical protein T11_9804 [Trichinella zimbabwensis]
MAYYPKIRLSKGSLKLSTFPNQSSMTLFMSAYSNFHSAQGVSSFHVLRSSVKLFPHPQFFGKLNSTVTTVW